MWMNVSGIPACTMVPASTPEDHTCVPVQRSEPDITVWMVSKGHSKLLHRWKYNVHTCI